MTKLREHETGACFVEMCAGRTPGRWLEVTFQKWPFTTPAQATSQSDRRVFFSSGKRRGLSQPRDCGLFSPEIMFPFCRIVCLRLKGVGKVIQVTPVNVWSRQQIHKPNLWCQNTSLVTLQSLPSFQGSPAAHWLHLK